MYHRKQYVRLHVLMNLHKLHAHQFSTLQILVVALQAHTGGTGMVTFRSAGWNHWMW